ncbi:MAG: sugar isomerase, partial [Bacteroidetes bacterium]
NLIPAQLFAYYKSIENGLNPDAPSNNGTIHRVVQGVNIYPFEKNKLQESEIEKV